MSTMYLPRATYRTSLAPQRLLLAPAAYNFAWGLVAIAAPTRLARAIGFDGSGDGMGWRAAGVVILAYAPAYLWASLDRAVARPIVATALLGKAIGAVGWFAGLLTGRFPLRTLPLALFNDLLWLPGMTRMLRLGHQDR